MIGLVVLLGAFAVDRWYGEWPDRLHPVVWMGKTIRQIEHWAPTGRAGGQFVFGAGAGALAMLLELRRNTANHIRKTLFQPVVITVTRKCSKTHNN